MNLHKTMRLRSKTTSNILRATIPAQGHEKCHASSHLNGTFFAFSIGTATATLVNTYGRLRTLGDVNSTTSGHVLTPRPPTSKREPFCCACGKTHTYTCTCWRGSDRRLAAIGSKALPQGHADRQRDAEPRSYVTCRHRACRIVFLCCLCCLELGKNWFFSYQEQTTIAILSLLCQ